MDASIRPKGILDFLSQQEICQLSDTQNGGLNVSSFCRQQSMKLSRDTEYKPCY